MKQFYSCIDVTLPAPQPEQHELIRKIAISQQGKVIFYGAEEYSVAACQPYIHYKLRRTPGIDGVIFFTINQFCYGTTFNLKLLRDILNDSMSVHFARENVNLCSIYDLTSKFIEFSAYFHANSKRTVISDYIVI